MPDVTYHRHGQAVWALIPGRPEVAGRGQTEAEALADLRVIAASLLIERAS